MRQLDVIQEQEATIRTLCADQCDRPPVGCCTGEHHVLLSLADILISQPTQDALHLAHVLTGLQRREHDNALGQGMIPAPGPCHCLTESGCSLRLFKSPRCLHYLCPQVQRALIAVHGDSVVGFLEAMHETCNTVIRGLDDFTSGQVIAAAETLFPH